MGTRESYAPGTFSWAELVTSDADAAKRFYADVFGWDYEDNPMDDQGGVYSMARVGGRYVAALFGSDQQAPHWNSYVTVASADDTARQASEAGATVLAEPFDVFTSGRMAVIQDPTGAIVHLWQAGEHIGAGLVNAHGALAWNDLMTTDVGAASEFYCGLFGWEVAPVEGAPGDRVVIRNGETMNGGMATLPESASGAPPHWLPYFGVDDADAAAEAVKAGGGEVVAGPIEVPGGRFIVFTDPQGAGFAVVTGDMDD
jgi:predicted enzyme related to lactoylglutathione lyase